MASATRQCRQVRHLTDTDSNIASDDPEVLAETARSMTRTSRATALYCAGLAGHYAALRGVAIEDCPFTDPADKDMAEKWCWWHRTQTNAVIAQRNNHTADLLKDFTA